nr:MAG TPA: major capsid protein [Microviridae sp.]
MLSNTSSPISRHEVFSRVPKSNAVVYSTFDRSHSYLTCFNASYLIPAFIDEVYPGDIFSLSGRHLSRLIASIHPFMSNLTLSAYFFNVPTRLVWNKFKPFMGERRRPDESISDSYQVPMLNSGSTGVEFGSIFDFCGIPPKVPNLEFSALPLRAINLCYNEWFRDENLCPWLQVGGTGSTEEALRESEFGDSDQLSNYSLFKRAKYHDYFTSALPFQQKGPAMSISIGDSAKVDVMGNGRTLGLSTHNGNYGLVAGNSNQALAGNSSLYGADIKTPWTGVADMAINVPAGVTTDPVKSGLTGIAHLENATGFTISDLRTAIQLQALKELNARTGTRYKEIINGEWNVTISDATLDRPEFLGSYKIPFNIVTVASTVETSETPQGNLSAYGITDNSLHFGFSKAFEEHGYVIGFLCVTTDQTYQQGLNRMWSRKNRYDFYTPLLANISEQAVKMKEILAQGSNVKAPDGSAVDDSTFGYQEAWSELRYKPNMITGYMRSTAPKDKTFDIWHLGALYAPTIIDEENLGIPLNEDFINDNTDEILERVLAVKGVPQILSDNYFRLKCSRELPIYSVPSYLLGGRL